jgi:PIN domain nuclease of toxin-antitoxin system
MLLDCVFEKAALNRIIIHNKNLGYHGHSPFVRFLMARCFFRRVTLAQHP